MAALAPRLSEDRGESFLEWLKRHGQTAQAIDRFWKTILVSALNEDLDRVSVPYAAQVVRESFLKSPAAGRMGIPTVPLTDLYSTAGEYIRNRGGEIQFRAGVESFRGEDLSLIHIYDVRMEEVPVPEIGAGEILLRVHTCGICGTDLKKISTGSHSAPRIFGHETSGVVARVGEGVRTFGVGDRVVVFHHIPCGECYYCQHKTFAQCSTYKKVGCTAGFEPSGGGFAEYVRVMDWIVEKGTVRIPDGISFEQASFVEPVNTCIKGIETLRLQAGETVLVTGQGPIGLILANLAKRAGARVITSDLHPARLTIAHGFGLNLTIDASKSDAAETVRGMTQGRGADAVILAVGGSGLIRPAMDAARPGGRVLLFRCV